MGPVLELSENVVSSKLIKDGGYIKLSQKYIFFYFGQSDIAKRKIFLDVKKAFLIQQKEILLRKAL